jgi:hypothetical protein
VRQVPLLYIYLAGVGLGLALVWPLGPIAFVLVIALLLVVATIVWPVIMLGLMAIAALGIWLL